MGFNAKGFNELTAAEVYEILKARAEIFIVEQRINCQDIDGIDYNSLHCFMTEDNIVTAYLRAFYDGGEASETVRIGRVLTLKHGIGDGRRLMEQSLSAIKVRMRCKKVVMNAQKYAIPFYEKFGFRVVSEDFLEEGIVHAAMEMIL